MKLSDLGEFGLIGLLKKGPATRDSRHATIAGIGDDAAVLRMNGGVLLLATTDTFVEGVHFKLPRDPFFSIGQKAMLANVSDIAAMGGIPTHALVTIGLSKKISVENVKALYRGIDSIAKKCKIDIVGGDTVSSPKALIVSITLLGEVEKKYLLLRSGARPGDLICVTGKFGGSAAQKYEIRNTKYETNIEKARNIAKSQTATAMIDSSDGLVRSVLEICKASKVGARIYEDKVPVARGATLQHALYGGEEYELVFTAPKGKAGKYKVVGEIVGAKSGVKLIDAQGKIKPLKSGGYEHFRHN